jgi:hypothetical protein
MILSRRRRDSTSETSGQQRTLQGDEDLSLWTKGKKNRKMVLFERLRSTRMLKDELAAIEEIVDPNSMVRTALNNFTKPWGPFVRGIVAQELLPTWERLWDDFVQQETRLTSGTSGQQQTVQGDEDLSLWTKGKKKVDKSARPDPKFGTTPQGERSSGKKRDMSKVKYFVCKKMGHYAGQSPNKKKKKGGTATTAKEAKF